MMLSTDPIDLLLTDRQTFLFLFVSLQEFVVKH